MVNGLRRETDLDSTSTNPCKCQRESEIRKSEERVRKIMKILKEDFLNPFDANIDPDRLYNLASGSPIGDDIAEHLLTVQERGHSMMNEFCERLVGDKNPKKSLFDPIKRAAWKSFADTGRKMKVTSKDKLKEIMVQRDILGLLAAKSQKRKVTVNIDAALCYPWRQFP